MRTIEHGNLIDERRAKLMAEKGAYLVANIVAYVAMKERAAQFGMTAEMLAKNELVLEGGCGRWRSAGAPASRWPMAAICSAQLRSTSATSSAPRAGASPARDHPLATTIGAQVVRIRASSALEPGACADLIVVDGDPLKDLRSRGPGRASFGHHEGRALPQEPAQLRRPEEPRRRAVVPGWIGVAHSRPTWRLEWRGRADVAAYILTPLIFVTWLAFFRQEIPSFPPEGYSLRWFAAIAGNDAVRLTASCSACSVGVIATLIGLAVGVPAAALPRALRFTGREVLNSLLLMPLIVPGVVLGIALYVFHVETEIDDGLPILGSLGGLVAGHVLIVIPWTVRLVMASLAGFDRAVEEAAQSLGANRWTTFRRITLPAILPGIVAAALFGFVASFGNLEISLFLVGPGRTTLPIAILQYLEWKIDPTIAAVSVVQIVLIGAAMLITDRFVKISRVV